MSTDYRFEDSIYYLRLFFAEVQPETYGKNRQPAERGT